MTTNSQMLTDQNKDTNVMQQEIEYSTGIKGLFVKPETPGDYPGVVMIHEWWGLNDNIKSMAVELAKHGYQVLAVDLYGGKVATSAADAQALKEAIDQNQTTKNLRDAAQYLKNYGSTKVASLGWCFGGAQSLQLAMSGEALDATVVYYGFLPTDKEKISKIKWPMLGIFGEQDALVPPDAVKQFEATLNSLNIPNNITIYPDVGHAFANPSGPNFAPEPTRDAWNKVLGFLSENLKR